ncbi:MAG TPA: hypothetical protein VIR45_13995 [Kiloniellaceae bacterium]
MFDVKAIEIHAVQRAKERYGVTLTAELKHRLVREIKRSMRRHRRARRDSRNKRDGSEDDLAAWLLYRSPVPGREIWKVSAAGREFKLVYDARGQSIVTFLPLDR